MEEPSFKVIDEISDNDLDFKNNLIEILKKEFIIEVENFNSSLAQEHYIEASDCVHKLKHKISLLGLQEGLTIAADFEKQLKNGNLELHQKFMDILNKINVYLYN